MLVGQTWVTFLVFNSQSQQSSDSGNSDDSDVVGATVAGFSGKCKPLFRKKLRKFFN